MADRPNYGNKLVQPARAQESSGRARPVPRTRSTSDIDGHGERWEIRCHYRDFFRGELSNRISRKLHRQNLFAYQEHERWSLDVLMQSPYADRVD